MDAKSAFATDGRSLNGCKILVPGLSRCLEFFLGLDQQEKQRSDH